MASDTAWRKVLLLNGALALLKIRSLPPLRMARAQPIFLDLASAQSCGRDTRPIWISPEYSEFRRCESSAMTRKLTWSRYGSGAAQYPGLRTSSVWSPRTYSLSMYGPDP